MKKNKSNKINVSRANFIKLIILPFLLLVFWVFSSLFLNEKISFTVLRHSYHKSSYENFNSGKLTKSTKIVGQLRAKENYLGIVDVRFNDFLMDNNSEELLSFKIREKNKKDWYYESKYRIGYLAQSSYFPFGFSPISDSNNKTYEFEIESSPGAKTNPIQLSRKEPVIITEYQIPKVEITGNKFKLLKYLGFKIINSFLNLDFLFSSFIYFIPLLSYLLWILILKKIKTKHSIIPLVVLGVLYLDVFFLKSTSLSELTILSFIWIVSIKLFKLSSKITFVLSFLLVAVWLLLNYIGINSYSDKLNIWTYILLAIGTIQVIFESRDNE